MPEKLTPVLERSLARDREDLSKIILELERRKEAFSIDPEVIETLTQYNSIAKEIPEGDKLVPGNRKSVEEVQKSYHSLLAMSDFTSSNYLEAQTRLRVIAKLERYARNSLISGGVLKASASGPTTQKTAEWVVPELYDQKEKWENFRDMCKHILGRLRDAMFLMRDSVKAEEIFRAFPRV